MEEKTKEKSEREEERRLKETNAGETKTEEKKSEKGKEKTAELKKQLAELTDLLQRTQANFENYRKQQEKRTEELQSLANKGLILQLLPVLDNFELALKNIQNIQVPPKDFWKGMELIYSQLFTLLESQGLQPIPTENQFFNPRLHEALLKVSSEQPENIILEEFQKGFLLNHQVIRPAKVKVSSGKTLENPEKTENPEKNEKTHQNEKNN